MIINYFIFLNNINFIDFILEICILFNIYKILTNTSVLYIILNFLLLIFFGGLFLLNNSLDLLAIILWIIYYSTIIIFFIIYISFYSKINVLIKFPKWYLILLSLVIYLSFYFNYKWLWIFLDLNFLNYYQIYQNNMFAELEILGNYLLTNHIILYFLIINVITFTCFLVVNVFILIRIKNFFHNLIYSYKNITNITSIKNQKTFLQTYNTQLKKYSFINNRLKYKFHYVRSDKRRV